MTKQQHMTASPVGPRRSATTLLWALAFLGPLAACTDNTASRNTSQDTESAAAVEAPTPEERQGEVSPTVADDPTTPPPAPLVPPSPVSELSAEYVHHLWRKYGHRITFHDEYAKYAIADFNIDCRAPDRRYLPLINVILAKLASMDSDRMYMTTEALSRDGEVRVQDVMVDGNGQEVHRSNTFELDKWGGLRMLDSVRPEAIRNSCFMGYGEIWIIPGQ